MTTLHSGKEKVFAAIMYMMKLFLYFLGHFNKGLGAKNMSSSFCCLYTFTIFSLVHMNTNFFIKFPFDLSF